MRVPIAYGERGLIIEVPDDALVVTPVELTAVADEYEAVIHGLRHTVSGPPLADRVRPGMSVAVVFPDITRPMPNKTVLPPLLRELDSLGLGRSDVTLLCATGTHRRATRDEMEDLVGYEILRRYRVHQHVATDGDHIEVGEVDGVPILIDRRYVEADVRILTGFVEPHFFAGFSGGPKGVCPGLAALETTLEAHSPKRIGDPRSTWTVLNENPVHRFVSAAAALVPPTFSLDVAINSDRRLTAVFGGSLPRAHRVAATYVERMSVRRIRSRFDVVVTTNAGFPLDRNLYQAVKGMAAAERVVTDGGTIIMASACVDGLPGDSEFARLLRDANSPATLVDPASPSTLDGWQAQVLGRVLSRARVQLYTDGLTEDEVRDAHLEPVTNVSSAVADALRSAGPGASVCVLPSGPLTVATPAD